MQTEHFLAHMSQASMGDPRLPIRFWDKVAVAPSGCWLWTASLNHAGYGYYHLRSRRGHGQAMHLAHRVAYQALTGEIPDERPHLDHLCRTPACVNPAHLEPVTQAENNRRMNAHIQPVTHCIHGHEFTPENTYWRPSEPGARSCRTCVRDACRRYQVRRRGATT